MTIANEIDEYEKRANDNAIASKILEKMDMLRLENNDNSSKRWIWELLQNAKDCVVKKQKIKVNVNFNKISKILEFSHNGQPFTLENIIFLTKQVSTKERNNSNNEVLTTGKFGTGFLSTHLLSEIVELESVVLYKSTYKKFQITLDRSGRDKESVLKAIEKSFEQIYQIDMNSPMKDFNQTAFNTKFTYKLNERGLVIAEQGLKDLKACIFYVLIFIKNIYSVQLEHEDTEYILSEKVIQLSENIQKYSITEITSNAKKIYEVVVVSNDNVYIAMPIISTKDNIVFDTTNKKSAKLFCDFPLVGTENFPFPAIINCSNFNPTEPRDGIFLTDIEDEKISENKSIIKKAYSLLYELIDFASFNNWGKTFALAQFPKTFEAKWVDSNWLNTELTDQLIDKLFTTPIVDTIDKKRKAVRNTDNEFNVWFPADDKPEVREMIWKLYSKYIPEILPLKEEIHEWYISLIKDKTKLTVKEAFKDISSESSIEQLNSNLRDNVNVFKWLNYFYKIVETNKNESFINNDEYKVLPNQNGDFINKTDLKIDVDIEDKIKDAIISLGIDVRKKLLHKEVKYPINLKFENLTQSEVVENINNLLKYNSKIDKLESCKLLIALFPNDENETKKRKKLYDFYLKIDKSFAQVEQKIITNWTEEIWEEVDKIIMKEIIKKVSDLQNIQALANEITDGNVINALDWLNSVIEFLVKKEFALIDNKTIPFLPNQNGNFCIREDLYLDNGEID
jgi:transcriptional regulator NrdR family protein